MLTPHNTWQDILKARSKLGMANIRRLHELMSDGKWRTAAEISEKLDLGETRRVAAYMLRWTADNLTLGAKHIKRRRRKDKYITEAKSKDSRGRPLNMMRWVGE
tara:strand:- start:5099 stop:5410 length:312 start_codon:yes stop_codon:yes gene_type:complete